MKGILLAGGAGSRLNPVTVSISKHLLPIYNKPMIYYSLSVLMLAKIREILVICTERDLPLYRLLLGNGENFGVSLSYKVQNSPRGIADAFILGEDFIGSDSVCLALGDNIFYGESFTNKLNEAAASKNGATLFACRVKDPHRFGVVELDENFYAISIEEKPTTPRSNYAVTGLYFYDNMVIDIAKSIIPSARGELEITTVNEIYLEKNKLKVQVMGRGAAWLDTGTADSLLEASHYVQTLEHRQGTVIACLEEIALNNGWLSKENIYDFVEKAPDNEYYSYLRSLLD